MSVNILMFSQDGQYMEAEDSRPVCGVVCTTLKVVVIVCKEDKEKSKG